MLELIVKQISTCLNES